MLSDKLGLSRNTVVRAYEQLRVERLSLVREGSGTYVGQFKVPRAPFAVSRPVQAQSAYACGLSDRNQVIRRERSVRGTPPRVCPNVQHHVSPNRRSDRARLPVPGPRAASLCGRPCSGPRGHLR